MTQVKMDQLFENKDIMRLIYSFGYPQHRIYMKQLCYQMDTVLTGYNITPKNWPKDCIGGESLCSFLARTKSRDELIDMYHIYKNCHCCTRHCYYKPNLYELNENIKINPNPHYAIPPNGMSKKKFYGCKCGCRSYIREVYSALTEIYVD